MTTPPKHTAGSWHIGNFYSYNAGIGRPERYVYRGDNESCETRICVRGGEGENGQKFDCDADAALIAQAPDMELMLWALSHGWMVTPYARPGNSSIWYWSYNEVEPCSVVVVRNSNTPTINAELHAVMQAQRDEAGR